MALSLRQAAGLLVGSGGAGALTASVLVLGDVQGVLSQEARLAALAFALLLTVPIAMGLTWALRPGNAADKRVRAFATFGTLLWIAGLGIDLYNPSATQGLLTAGHALALLGGAGLAMGGLTALASSGPLRRKREARG